MNCCTKTRTCTAMQTGKECEFYTETLATCSGELPICTSMATKNGLAIFKCRNTKAIQSARSAK
jgi:hypothetical protein